MAEEQRPSPDQNDPTGHTREGSPTYHPGTPRSNNQKPMPGPRNTAGEAERGEEQPQQQHPVGVLHQPEGQRPNVPEPSPPTGGPD